ncbi:MAG: TIGR01777 family oxidoreductase [Ignavibacteriales bacterium]
MPKKVVITGATGLIGSHLVRALKSRGDELTLLTRSPSAAERILPGAAQYIKWDPGHGSKWEKCLDEKDAVIHLAGAPVMDKRWTHNYKEEILKSRQSGTHQIVDAIASASVKPGVLVSASAIGYYGTEVKGPVTEADEAGEDFLAGVCKIWETEAARAEDFGVRRVSIRIGIVLDKSGGALPKMTTPFNYFIGGPLGRGDQGFSWIHIEDLVEIFIMAIDDNSMQGPYNATAPNPVTMGEFALLVGNMLHRPAWLKVPEFALRLVIGEGASSITKAPLVLPERLIKSGYKFRFRDAKTALSNLLENS